MNKQVSNTIIMKRVVSLIASITIGTFVLNVGENSALNVWVARGIGAIVTLITYLIFHHYWFKKK